MLFYKYLATCVHGLRLNNKHLNYRREKGATGASERQSHEKKIHCFLSSHFVHYSVLVFSVGRCLGLSLVLGHSLFNPGSVLS